MQKYDAIVVGGGLLGCFTARNLKRYCLSVALVERNDDVCMEISRANTAIVYSGCDNRPGSMKAEMTVRANREFDNLCMELDVPFLRCGSVMVAYGSNGDAILERKYRHGLENGVPGIELISPEEAKKREPSLGNGITKVLFCPSTGTVNPWELCIAAYENAIANGVDVFLNTVAERLCVDGVETDKGTIEGSFVIDCSGINAGKIINSRYRISPDAADYLILDRESRNIPKMIVFEQSEEKCRGITAVPTVEGSVLVGPTHRECTVPFATKREGTDQLMKTATEVLPDMEMKVIRTFAALRPNVETENGEDVFDFAIDQRDNYLSFIGVKTPGMTCADELGRFAADKCAGYLNAEINPDFNPKRTGIRKIRDMDEKTRTETVRKNADYGKIVCRCSDISEGEIKEAIDRGAVSVDGIKHRVGTSMGACQGTRCDLKIKEILENYHA